MTDIAGRLNTLTPEQRAQLALRLSAKSPQPATRPASEPIAILGVGCRFPGGGTSPQAFWDSLIAGTDAIREVPAERWRPTGANADLMRWGGFLDEVDRFDPGFFGLSPREAAHMDPQQRLLLETAWEALEDAGRTTDDLAGSATGVFVGAHSHSSDYFLIQAEAQGGYDTYSATGSAHSILANRLSFFLDLRGPSLSLDTACSSSLVAVHTACQSLRTGEIDMALAGGVNLMLTSDFHGCLSTMEMLAPDGRCKTFDNRADGFVRGEGCGVVVLARLADAVRRGDPILAVILASAVNQDGASNGLTAPNGLAQQTVIRRALELGGVAPGEVGYVETHGTGTQLGDPIEVEALATVLRSGSDAAEPCVLGAVKSNIGHLEGAAGIAGLIKATLALKNEQIPANLHLQAVNPHLADHVARFTLPAQPQAWPRSARRRVAGVSSFGFGGTNAHIVLAEAPLGPAAMPAAAADTPLLLPVSARSEDALRALGESYADFLARDGADLPPCDLAYSAARRRLHHDHRLCAVGSGPAEWAASMGQQIAPGFASPAPDAARDIAFVFSGQGGMRPEAGAQLLASEPVFRAAIEACDASLRRHAPFSLVDELRAPAGRSRIERADVGQPVLFALQVGLEALWRSWGVQPSRVMGHSIGEIAAAHAGGALGLDDAMSVAFHRGRILQDAVGLGGMAMIGLPADETGDAIARVDPHVSIAAYNSPVSCIVSGSVESLRALVEGLQARGVFARVLNINYPSHSPALAPFARRLEAALADLRPRIPAIPIVSTVTGERSAAGAFTAGYWASNLVQPVLFATGIETLARDGATTFLEIGPHPVLRTAIEQCEGRTAGPLLTAGSLMADQPDALAMRENAALLYRAGAALDWAKLAPSGRCVTLPRYAWDRQRYWLPKRSAALAKAPALASVPDSWLYELAWQPAEPIGGARSSLAGVDLGQSAERLSREAAARFGAGDDADVRAALEATAAGHVLAAFAELGAAVTPGAIWPAEGLVDALGIEPRFARLLDRMIGILAENGVLTAAPAGWRVTRPMLDAPARHSAAEPAASLLAACGPHLAGVLRGEVEPLTLLFGSDQGSAEAIYRDASASRRSNEVVAEALRGWLEALPAGESVRILEIGAGTGATTETLLPLLPADRCEYLFTDVSPAFLAAAQERFGGQGFVRTALLDLEQDLASQGFAPGSFDLVIAANVAHATRDIDESLGRMRDLLADGGLLALVECTAAHAWMDITFGLTDGWWRFADHELRRSHPLLDAGQWRDALARTGFDDGRSVALQPASGDAILDQAMVLGRKPAARVAVAAVAERPSRYLVVHDGGETAGALAAQLKVRGDECLLASADSLQALDLTGDWGAVLYLAPDAAADLADAGGPLLTLAQRLIGARATLERGLLVVTRGCQARAHPGGAAAWQALLWGLARGISLEAPDLAPRLIDLDPAGADATAAILRELDRAGSEDQVALVGRDRLVPRIRPLPAGTLAARAPTLSGRHLVTGGLGRIGSRLALELARAGASELVLAVNRPLPDRADWDTVPADDAARARIETVRAIESAGARVLVEICDLEDPNGVGALLARPALAGRPLNGVWHAAMLLAPDDVATMSADTLAATVAVKARAAQALDRLTRDRDVEQFALFSSTTALWGARGLAHYAAANAYLDALAHARRAEGLPATVIDWGTWDIPASTAGEQVAQAQRAGLRPMSPDTAFAALFGALAAERTQTIVADVDWTEFKAVYEARRSRPLLSAIASVAPGPEVREAQPSADDPATRLAAASPRERDAIARELVRQALAAVLGIDAPDTIAADRGFFELGMDSLTSVQLRRRLEGVLARPLGATVAFKYPTIDALSAHIVELVCPNQAEVAAAPAHSASDPASAGTDYDDASEEQLFDLLAARLAGGRA